MKPSTCSSDAMKRLWAPSTEARHVFILQGSLQREATNVSCSLDRLLLVVNIIQCGTSIMGILCGPGPKATWTRLTYTMIVHSIHHGWWHVMLQATSVLATWIHCYPCDGGCPPQVSSSFVECLDDRFEVHEVYFAYSISPCSTHLNLHEAKHGGLDTMCHVPPCDPPT